MRKNSWNCTGKLSLTPVRTLTRRAFPALPTRSIPGGQMRSCARLFCSSTRYRLRVARTKPHIISVQPIVVKKALSTTTNFVVLQERSTWTTMLPNALPSGLISICQGHLTSASKAIIFSTECTPARLIPFLTTNPGMKTASWWFPEIRIMRAFPISTLSPRPQNHVLTHMPPESSVEQV